MASLFGLDLSKNFSFFTLPATFLLCLIPNAYSISLAGKSYDAANPRRMKDSVASDDKLDKARKERIVRAKNASDNGFETLGFYAAAVAAANHANVDVTTLNALTIGYVVSRLAYLYAYIVLGQNSNLAGVRSLCWMSGIGLTFALYIKAGLSVIA